jgi:hypothetical protein
MSEVVLRYWIFLLGADVVLVAVHLAAGNHPFWNRA